MASKTTYARAVRLRKEVSDWIFKEHKSRAIIESIYDLYDAGEIATRGDKVYVTHDDGEIDLERLKEIARGLGKSPQETLDMMIKRYEMYQ